MLAVSSSISTLQNQIDTVLVFAVWKYLCDEGKTKYYFTDLAHGAMNGKSKGSKARAKQDHDKYERWYSLF